MSTSKTSKSDHLFSMDFFESMLEKRMRSPWQINSKLIIGIATHKLYKFPSKTGYYPLFVGKAIADIIVPDGYYCDDLGDNISGKNNRYCELTGLYWLWKNTSSEYLGQVHYRRYFGFLSRRFHRDLWKQILEDKDIFRLLKQYEAILPKRRHYVVETIFSHYAHTHYCEHLEKMRDIIKEVEPDYLEAFDRKMNSRSAHMYNMFIMRRNLADAYCEWLFPLIDRLETLVDTTEYSEYQRRFIGRIGELLMDVWIEKNNVKYCEVPIVNVESVHYIKKGKAFLQAKYCGKKYDASF